MSIAVAVDKVSIGVAVDNFSTGVAVIAAAVGAFTPLILRKLDIDPAVYTAYCGFNRKVKDIVAFPAVTRDLNFKMSGEINVGDVCASINSVNQSILQNVKPVDIYQSKNDD